MFFFMQSVNDIDYNAQTEVLSIESIFEKSCKLRIDVTDSRCCHNILFRLMFFLPNPNI